TSRRTSSLAASVIPVDDLSQFCARAFFPQRDVGNIYNPPADAGGLGWGNQRDSHPSFNPSISVLAYFRTFFPRPRDSFPQTEEPHRKAGGARGTETSTLNRP